MELKNLWYDNAGIARSIILGDSGDEYFTNADSEFYRMWCSCPSNIFNPKQSCKHIKFLINNLEHNKMVKKNYIFMEIITVVIIMMIITVLLNMMI